MTHNQDELDEWQPRGIDVRTPNVARMYDYYLGGKDHYAPDREAAEQTLAHVPYGREMIIENRRFLGRAVRYLAADVGIRRFIDIGTGLPTAGNVHQIACQTAPDARVLYVDNDPVVCAHARALLAGGEQTAVVQADLRDPDAILTHPTVTSLLDFDAPIAVLAVAILHFLPDADDPWAQVARLRDALAPGSCLVVTHGADAPHIRQAAHTYARTPSGAATVRDPADIRRFFDGFHLVEPGLVSVDQWRPEPPPPTTDTDTPTVLYAGVGRKT